MRTIHSLVAAAVLCAVAAAPVSAEDRVPVMHANIEKALGSEINTRAFWEEVGNGWVREKRSGMLCAGELSPDLPLDFLSGPDASFSPVGCIYRSADHSTIHHIIISPNPLGTKVMRQMLRMTLDYKATDVVEHGTWPIADLNDGEEEAVSSVADGKASLHYLASAPVGSWIVLVHSITPRPEKFDRDTARVMPLKLLQGCLASVRQGR